MALLLDPRARRTHVGSMRAMLLALLACNLLSVDREEPLPEITLVPTSGPLTQTAELDLAPQSTGPASSAHITSITVAITPHEAPRGSFDFASSVRVTIEAPSDPKLPKREIAWLDPVPKGKTSLALDVDGYIDVLPYVEKGARVTAQITGAQPPQPVTFDGKVRIEAKL